jgi:5'-nucleotidase
MPYPIEHKLVIAISSSAVFDMEKANDVFVTKGEAAYRQYQAENVDEPFEKGVAYPFINRLLNLNTIFKKEMPIEVIVLSKNDPDTGLRFFKSCKHYGLNITRGAFLNGKEPHRYIEAFNASLFLSANESDVNEANKLGLPAGLVLPTKAKDEAQTSELRIAFDFDSVLADDEAEKVYQENGLNTFHASEELKAHQPLKPGPLQDLAKKLALWQEKEKRLSEKNTEYSPLLRIAIVTARNAPAHERCIRTLNEWGLIATETFFMGGIDKSRVLKVFKPHLFIDDQMSHLEELAAEVPCVHIPFGAANTKPAGTDK